MSTACRCAGSARRRPVTGTGGEILRLYSRPERTGGKTMTEPFRRHKVQYLAPGGLHRMAYLEWGDAANPRVLVCVHGLTRCARDFDFLGRELCGRYRV